MSNTIICHLSNFSPEYPGSFVDSLVSLAEYCRNRLQLGSVCLFPEEARRKSWLKLFQQKDVAYDFLPTRRLAVSEIRHALGQYQPVIFHTHFFYYDLCPIVLKLLYYRGSKVIWHYHDPTDRTVKQRIKDLIKFQVVGRWFGDRCVAAGAGVYDSLLEANLPADKLRLIPNGVQVDRFIAKHNERTSVRRRWGISDESTVFLLLGWEPYRKGVDIFLRAAHEFVSRGYDNAFFVVIGREETRSFLTKLPQAAALGSALRCIEPAQEFSTILAAADFLVSCSRREAFGYAIAEAMAAGKLILCSDIPGMRDVYGKAEGVSFFPSENSTELASGMLHYYTTADAERQRLGRENSGYVRANYSLDSWCQNIGQMYSELLFAR